MEEAMPVEEPGSSYCVGQVIGEKVYAAKCRENYVTITGKIAPKKIEDVVRELELFFSLQKGITLAQCDVCEGWSDNELSGCPYCDDGKDGTTPPPPVPTPSTSIIDLEPKKRSGSAPALSPLAGGRASKSERDLDAALGRFREHASGAADRIYLMGKEVIAFREELWMLRTDSGKPKYKSYNQFVDKELDISTNWANKIRRMAEVFTIEQFRQHGARALMAVVAAPKEVHEELLRVHSEGASISEIAEKAAEARQVAGISVMETDATREAAAVGRNIPSAASRETAAKTNRGRKKTESSAFTIGLKTADPFEIALHRKPKGARMKAKDLVPATAIEDQPFGEIEGINGVKLFLAVKKRASGELFIKATPQVEEDA